MSPELVTDACYNAKSDIWALGCLIYELCALEWVSVEELVKGPILFLILCHRPPFQAKSQAALSAKIRQGKVPELPKQYSNDLKTAIKSMLQTNVSSRCAFQRKTNFKV